MTGGRDKTTGAGMRHGIAMIIAAIALAACSNPLERVPTLSDMDVADPAARAEAVPGDAPDSIAEAETPRIDTEQAPRGGLLGFLRGRAQDATSQPELGPQAQPVALAPRPEAAPDPEGDAAAGSPEPDEAAADAPAAATAPGTGRGGRGLFAGLLSGGGTDDETDDRNPARAPKPGDPDFEQVGPGVTLPYGKVARLCGVSAGKLGSEIARYPERGRGYAIYDSAAGSTTPRSFYITGFDDGCARQFTAALAVFGAPDVYEQIHYGPARETQVTSETDAAYEQVKSRVCRVPRGQPCGDRVDRLARDTVFVSIYERFGSNPRWKNLLLHDGAVMALDIKSR